MKQQSVAVIKQQIQVRMQKIGACSISITGTFLQTRRKCGKANCRCSTDESKRHPVNQLTSKVKGKTKAIYVPVGIAEEVKNWVQERKKIKRLLQEIDELTELLIRQHARRSRAVRANKKLLKHPPPPSSQSSWTTFFLILPPGLTLCPTPETAIGSHTLCAIWFTWL